MEDKAQLVLLLEKAYLMGRITLEDYISHLEGVLSGMTRMIDMPDVFEYLDDVI